MITSIIINKAVGVRAFINSFILTLSFCSDEFSVFAKPIPLLATITEINNPIAPPTKAGNS